MVALLKLFCRINYLSNEYKHLIQRISNSVHYTKISEITFQLNQLTYKVDKTFQALNDEVDILNLLLTTFNYLF